MFVTGNFVYVHQPKTGGTFVTAMLARIHEARGDSVETTLVEPALRKPQPDVRPGVVLKLMTGARHQHGTRSEIPIEYRDRPVLATIRNPYDRYVSQYEFAWWRTFPEMFGPVETVRKTYPRYPDLAFAEFVHLTNAVSVHYRREGDPERTPGFHTQQFVEYFCRDPKEALLRLGADDAALEGWAADLREVCFVNQERLNQELHAFLLRMEYRPEEIEFVAHAERIWPPEGGRSTDQHWTKYYSPALKSYVREKERLLFRQFPQFDV